nr:MAG TPA: hypothetical protein [Caudoviricetes sp.]
MVRTKRYADLHYNGVEVEIKSSTVTRCKCTKL